MSSLSSMGSRTFPARFTLFLIERRASPRALTQGHSIELTMVGI
jgi:hypothetical protein